MFTIIKVIMETSLERIRAKIAELEAKIADLHIAERELSALDRGPAPKEPTPRKPTPRKPASTKKAAAPLKAKRKPAAPAVAGPRQTIGGAITDVLGEHGPLPVAEIAEHIEAAGRAIDKRSISYSLQAMKKRGLVKSADGKWMLPKPRAKPTPA